MFAFTFMLAKRLFRKHMAHEGKPFIFVLMFMLMFMFVLVFTQFVFGFTFVKSGMKACQHD